MGVDRSGTLADALLDFGVVFDMTEPYVSPQNYRVKRTLIINPMVPRSAVWTMNNQWKRS
jgi:hypothetical protein